MKDEGVILFFIFLPIAYPLLYSWIYNNEVVRDVPVAVVDNSHSSLSWEFIKKMDSTPDVSVAYYCKSISEGQELISQGKAYGILYFPADFATKTGRMEQTHVGVYCDMSYMLTYKAILQSATTVSGVMGAEIQTRLSGPYTHRDEEISTKPVDFDDVPIFNVTGGYGNFIIPGVLILIIQQALLLGVGMIAGTRREKRRHSKEEHSDADKKPYTLWDSISLLMGQSMAYLMFFSILLAWITLIVPRLFGFVSLVHGYDLLMFFVPYLLACIAFAITASSMVRYRESVILVVVFTSVPLLFLAGVSWPQSNIPSVWQGVSWMFPSTFAVRGFIRMNSMGALLADVTPEYIALWIQTFIYTITALIVTHLRQYNRA